MKIKFQELETKTTAELVDMKNIMKIHLMSAITPKNLGSKGFSPKEERRNIARINHILKKRNWK